MERKLIIKNETGLHARPAAMFVKEATQFESNIEIKANGKSGNGKSIMSVMSLGITKDTEITLKAIGQDESEALKALESFIEKQNH